MIVEGLISRVNDDSGESDLLLSTSVALLVTIFRWHRRHNLLRHKTGLFQVCLMVGTD